MCGGGGVELTAAFYPISVAVIGSLYDYDYEIDLFGHITYHLYFMYIYTRHIS